MSNNKPEYPYLEYEKALEEVLKHASKDYWEQYTSINNHQVRVAKTYLWVAAAMLGAYSAIINMVLVKTLAVPLCSIFYCILAILSALCAFGVCLYSLPPRKGYMRIGESWGTFSKMAYDGLANKEKSLYRNVLTALVDEFDNASFHNLQTNNQRAILLRSTSWLLILSFCFSVVSTINIGIENLPSTKVEHTMTNETNSNSNTTTTNQGGTETKPDARPPQGPITTGKPQKIITHGDNTVNKTRVVITGGDIDKKFE